MCCPAASASWARAAQSACSARGVRGSTPSDEPAGELGLAEGERGAHERGQGGGVVGVGVDVRHLRELVQQRAAPAVGAPGRAAAGGGRERRRVLLWLAALADRREQLLGGRGVLVRAALGEQAQLHGARLGGGCRRPPPGALQAARLRPAPARPGRALRGRWCSCWRSRARTR